MLDYFKKNALIQFCEHKYVYSNYIAEYFNTISNLSYIFVGLYWLKSEYKYLKNLCYSCILTGIGSMLLHSTGNYYMELIDELSMFLITLNMLELFNKNCIYNVFIFNFYIKIFTFISIIYYLIYQSYTFFVNIITINIIAIIINIIFIKNISNKIKYTPILFILIAKICWEIEQSYCKYFYPFFILHSLWHIFGSISINGVINIFIENNKKNKYYSDKNYYENKYIKLNNYIKFN